MIPSRTIALCLLFFAALPAAADLRDLREREVEVECRGRDWLQTTMQIRERYDTTTGKTRFIGFSNQTGALGKLTFSFAYEALISRKRRQSLAICSISMYVSDSRGERSASFFAGGFLPGACASVEHDSKIVLGALPLKSDSDQFQAIDTCQFQLITPGRKAPRS